jgi:hypothetical protein
MDAAAALIRLSAMGSSAHAPAGIAGEVRHRRPDRARYHERMRTYCLPVVLLMLGAGCGGSRSSNDAGVADAGTGDLAVVTKPGGPPLAHRPIATCQPVPGNCTAGAVPDGGCSLDGDCTASANGRCTQSQGPCSCSYECLSDSDCPTNDVCGCAASLSAFSPNGNQCLPGNCHVDGDCGANGFCSPSLGQGCSPHIPLAGYYCHTASDACNNDSDCPTLGYCAYSPEVAHWACTYATCAG